MLRLESVEFVVPEVPEAPLDAPVSVALVPLLAPVVVELDGGVVAEVEVSEDEVLMLPEVPVASASVLLRVPLSAQPAASTRSVAVASRVRPSRRSGVFI